VFERVAFARRSQERAAFPKKASVEHLDTQLTVARRVVDEACGAVEYSEHFPSITLYRAVGHRANDRVQSGAVAAAREHSEFCDLVHEHLLRNIDVQLR
jgi:hypothetical protein